MLVAHPGLNDPNFSRTLLYLVAHTQTDGSLGLVLNRPLQGASLDELVKTETAPNMGLIPVYWGGPVATNQLSIARIAWQPVTRKIVFENNLTIEHATSLIRHPGCIVRAFVGYAGWSAGQLEREIEQGAWVVVPAREDYLNEPAGSLWKTVLTSLGPFFRLQADAPDDPSLN
jgi:putative transcriptional regulator